MFTCSNQFEVIYGYNLALFLKILLINIEKMGSEEISALTLVTAIINMMTPECSEELFVLVKDDITK